MADGEFRHTSRHEHALFGLAPAGNMIESGRRAQRLAAHQGQITFVGFAPDGTLVSGGFDRQAVIWTRKRAD